MVLFVSLKNTSDLFGDTLFPPACLSSCLHRDRLRSQGSWTCRIKWSAYQDPLWRSNLWNSRRVKGTCVNYFSHCCDQISNKKQLESVFRYTFEHTVHHGKKSWWKDFEATNCITFTAREQRKMRGMLVLRQISFYPVWDPQSMGWHGPISRWVFPLQVTISRNTLPKYTHMCVFMAILNPIKLTRLAITAPVVFKLEDVRMVFPSAAMDHLILLLHTFSIYFWIIWWIILRYCC